MTPFAQKVLRVVAKIPNGKVLTYKEVARRAGNPSAYRAVGNILSKNYNQKIPCHRVIRSDGSLGGYNRDIKTKRALLCLESRQKGAEWLLGRYKKPLPYMPDVSKKTNPSEGIIVFSCEARFGKIKKQSTHTLRFLYLLEAG